jgi:hypothetical protein
MKRPSFVSVVSRELRRALLPRGQPLRFSEKKALAKSFRKMIVTHLPGSGWKHTRSQFINVALEAERILFASLSDLELELWVKFAAGVRFKRVEDIWQQSQGVKLKVAAWTVEGHIAGHLPRAKLRYRIEDQRDLDFYEPKFCEIIDKACVPFWNEFATIADVDRIWNPKPFDFDRDGTNALHHAARSVIVAHLVGNPTLEDLVRTRRSEVEVETEMDPSLQAKSLEEFDRLVTWLCEHSHLRASC